MKPQPCLSVDPDLEATARLAEQRKHQALDELLRILKEQTRTPGGDAFETAMIALVEADKKALKARGR